LECFCFFLIGFLFLIYDEMRYENEISEIYDHNITDFDFKKPIEYLTYSQIDSLNNLKVEKPKIEVVGTGYSGYEFYMWFKPKEKGELFIKGFELTENKQISKIKLYERTLNLIDSISDNILLFKGETTIDEGTFEKFYPVRFELWFKTKDGNNKKITEKIFLIDGWDRSRIALKIYKTRLFLCVRDCNENPFSFFRKRL